MTLKRSCPVLRGLVGSNAHPATRLYGFVQMLVYKCSLYGKELVILDERDTSKTCSQCGQKCDMPLWKRTYHCMNCGLIMDRDDNSARNILMRFLAGLRPHTGVTCPPDRVPVRCAGVFTAIDDDMLGTFQHI